jgi:hypothetical protein
MKVTVRGLAGLACVAAALAVPTPAIAAPTAVRIRIGDHPGFVRVVVDMRGGRVSANGLELAGFTDVLATGRQRVQLVQAGVRTRAAAVRREGIAASIARGTGRITLTVRGQRRRFKLVALFVLRAPERIVVDLENQFAVAVRDVHGGIRARRTIGGQPGRTWRVRLAYRVSRRQAGTIEAFDLSARDGRVDCLVQDRALLLP